MKELFFIIFGYLFGSIPFGYVLCKIFTKKDIRNYGSGNIGATNVYRVAGGFVAVGVLILDILKGFLPVFIAKTLYDFSPLWLLAIGIAPVLGHNFSLFMKGKGGKGVSTSFGVIIGLFPKAALFSFVIWALLIIITHYVSVGALTASLSLPFFIYLFHKDISYVSAGILLFILIWFSHKGNIKRILKGKENRIRLPWEKK
jgi:glycerol-3-phosphate acyltransferase PlsY